MTTVDINFTGRDAEGMTELGRKLDKFISDSILENERSLRADGCPEHLIESAMRQLRQLAWARRDRMLHDTRAWLNEPEGD